MRTLRGVTGGDRGHARETPGTLLAPRRSLGRDLQVDLVNGVASRASKHAEHEVLHSTGLYNEERLHEELDDLPNAVVIRPVALRGEVVGVVLAVAPRD